MTKVETPYGPCYHSTEHKFCEPCVHDAYYRGLKDGLNAARELVREAQSQGTYPSLVVDTVSERLHIN